MELFSSPTSPFVRKARIAVRELGLQDRIDETPINAWSDERLRAFNPMCKVPTLVCDDGGVLYESALICDYLDALQPRRLFPADGAARWRALRLQGLADGVMGALVRWYSELLKPNPDLHDARGIPRFEAATAAALDALERETWTDDFLIGEISVACLLGYLDLRFAQLEWRKPHPRLAAWFAHIETRPSVHATRPPQ